MARISNKDRQDIKKIYPQLKIVEPFGFTCTKNGVVLVTVVGSNQVIALKDKDKDRLEHMIKISNK